MSAKMITRGPWQIAVKVIACLCPDGKRRTVYITGAPDTFFSIPARVKAYGKTVTGFVTGRDNNGDHDYEFIPYLYRKNHNVFNKGGINYVL